jgi:hypothetical protein
VKIWGLGGLGTRKPEDRSEQGNSVTFWNTIVQMLTRDSIGVYLEKQKISRETYPGLLSVV